MLGKLMKHEFRATSRIMIALPLLVLVLAIFGNLSTRLLSVSDNTFLNLLSILMLAVYFIAFFGSLFLTIALMVYRFYRNFMTDEGYLMFTLPVSTHQLVWSKLVPATVWCVVISLIDCLSILILLLQQGFLSEISIVLEEAFAALSPYLSAHIVLLVVEIIIIALISVLSSLLMFYAAIAIGHSFATHKKLLSVVFYFVLSGINQILSIIYTVIFEFVEVPEIAMSETLSFAHIYMWSGIILTALTAAAFYILTIYMLRRRLNLE